MRVCPMCGKEYDGYPAISRKDNKTEICSDCGVAEALEDWMENDEKDGSQTLKIMDFQNIAYDTGIILNDVASVDVEVITGDELLTICLKDGGIYNFDADYFSGKRRYRDYYDGKYHVENLHEWNNRKTTYDYVDGMDMVEGVLEWLVSLC